MRVATSGAAKLDAEVRRPISERFGVELSEGYGLTEASPVVTSVDRACDAPPGRSACPSRASRCAWSTPTARTCWSATRARSGCGARTCSRATGTTPRPPRAALTDDGWLRTGDIAVVDDDGYLFLVDRAKDLIIVSGFNVFPAEVEEVLLEHPAIAAGRGGRRAPPALGRGGEGLRGGGRRACPSRRTTSSRYCEAHLARYKCPEKVMFVDEMPQGVAGKVLPRTPCADAPPGDREHVNEGGRVTAPCRPPDRRKIPEATVARLPGLPAEPARGAATPEAPRSRRSAWPSWPA